MTLLSVLCHLFPLLFFGPLLSGKAAAEPVTLRMAAIAPEGTAWARELRALTRDIELQSGGALRMKWYLGGIAGDELQALDRVRRGQLDGVAGAILCQRLAPALRAARLVGLFQSRDEAIHVIARLKPTLDQEFAKAGFVNLGVSVFGVDVLFSRQPVRSMADLRGKSYWAWSLDPIWQTTLPELGASPVTSNLEGLAPAYAQGRIDGFFVVPSAALAYQWSTQAPYFSDLEASVLPGCLVVATSAIDPLPTEQRQILQAAAAKFLARFNGATRELDSQLVGGLFEKQGMIKVPASPAFKSEFMAAARRARAHLGPKLVPPALAAEVDRLLDDYRTQRARDAHR
jgi:TRAP-type C4-dicarboxylate transport system substrate-binding protein